jgi:hypothetical protein
VGERHRTRVARVEGVLEQPAVERDPFAVDRRVELGEGGADLAVEVVDIAVVSVAADADGLSRLDDLIALPRPFVVVPAGRRIMPKTS